jgi:copper(I)-binding protein
MFRALLVAIALAVPLPAVAQQAGDMQISGTWARATPKGAQVGGGYLKITNTGKTPDRLIGGASAVADKFEVHEMSMNGSVMKMRPVTTGLEIKPGETVEFKPGGYHVMFVGLKEPLAEGKPISATLIFEKAGKVDVTFDVRGIGAQSAPASHGGMGH